MLLNLSPLAHKAITDYCNEIGLDELAQSAKFNLDACCYLYFLLRKVVDTDTVFPRGKWTTLQALEQALDREANEELESLLREARERKK